MRLGGSITGREKMAPIELRTARRRNGLAHFSPAMSPWAPRDKLLRTMTPTFSAFVRPSSATNNLGVGALRTNSSMVG